LLTPLAAMQGRDKDTRQPLLNVGKKLQVAPDPPMKAYEAKGSCGG